MLLVGSHVSFSKETQILGSVKEALSYGSNCFMFYTGAPQNSVRLPINDDLTKEAIELMKDNNIDINNVVVHAPYIINLANTLKIDNYNFSIDFLINECKRCEQLGINKIVLHPGSHVGSGIEQAIKSISEGLNKVLSNTSVTILLETMAGKGTEVGTIDDIIKIIDNITFKDKIGICLDTCHLFDNGYDFNEVLETLKENNLLNKVKCIHLNDSKNETSSHKDRHANIGYGNIGFDNLIDVCYHKELENIPKILETPWVNGFPPYKFEIDMIKNKKFNKDLDSLYKKIRKVYFTNLFFLL